MNTTTASLGSGSCADGSISNQLSATASGGWGRKNSDTTASGGWVSNNSNTTAASGGWGSALNMLSY